MSRRRRIVLWSALALITMLIVVAGLIVSVTQTDYGQSQVRRYVQTWIAGKTHGTFYVGRITGGLFRGVTIDSVEIRDEKDSLFVASGPVRIRYDMRDLFDRRVLLSHVDVQRLKVRLNEQADGKWNYQHIFPSGAKKPRGASIKFGDFIVIDSADLHNASVSLGLKWKPSDSLRGYRRDSVIRKALGSFARETPGNQWRQEFVQTDEGYRHIYRFRNLNASFGYAAAQSQKCRDRRSSRG
jgi:hypothetical protein